MTIKGILFDKDGVLVDFERTWQPPLIALAHDLAGGDVAVAEDYLLRAGYDAASDRFLPGSIWAAGNNSDLVAVWDRTGTDAGRQVLIARIQRHLSTVEQAPIIAPDDLRPLLGGLRERGHVLGIATNDSEASAESCMAAFGVRDLFDVVSGYDSVANPKPSPDPVLRFCDLCRITPADVAMIGDNMHDIDMARAAGCGVAVAVLSGNTTAEEFAGRADHVIPDVSHLPDLIGELSTAARSGTC